MPGTGTIIIPEKYRISSPGKNNGICAQVLLPAVCFLLGKCLHALMMEKISLKKGVKSRYPLCSCTHDGKDLSQEGCKI